MAYLKTQITPDVTSIIISKRTVSMISADSGIPGMDERYGAVKSLIFDIKSLTKTGIAQAIPITTITDTATRKLEFNRAGSKTSVCIF